ncbi:hypothetical protein IGS73_03940 [Janibacter indicus]|uniref:Uncharacterized protein n=1 Tax=Janibacter indicus TaxID=857417 RepID=A0A7L9J2H6_9MICO|nr:MULTISPECIES: hypothetical protein [Janibacter]QNF94941.1 hypothetical protein H7A72_03880 [Janibacter sp. YB324]QOK23564.1 hypothetical protein IGS73_03940 [Janibacter indicus]
MSTSHTPTGSPSEVAPATVAETRDALIDRSRRDHARVPHNFVQRPRSPNTTSRVAPLATFVRNGDTRGLNAFLLLHTVITSGASPEGWSTRLPLQVWARAFNTVATASGSSATSAATKILTRLERLKLIERQRQGRERQVKVTLLSADGSGDPYLALTGQSESSRFLKLSNDYWTERWDERLTLPAIATLLVVLKEKPRCALPTEHFPAWYGWSADTAMRGFRELEDNGLITIDQDFVTAPLSPTGISQRNLYTARPPFDAAYRSFVGARSAPHKPA